jgi:hypothetical protein
MEKSIYITEFDIERLEKLLDGANSGLGDLQKEYRDTILNYLLTSMDLSINLATCHVSLV